MNNEEQMWHVIRTLEVPSRIRSHTLLRLKTVSDETLSWMPIAFVSSMAIVCIVGVLWVGFLSGPFSADFFGDTLADQASDDVLISMVIKEW